MNFDGEGHVHVQYAEVCVCSSYCCLLNYALNFKRIEMFVS